MERLARLADRRARWVLIVAATLFVAAGALGAGVADRLDPFGADDPDTESVIAEQRLEQAGFRPTGLVVHIDDVDVRAPGQASRHQPQLLGRPLPQSLPRNRTTRRALALLADLGCRR